MQSHVLGKDDLPHALPLLFLPPSESTIRVLFLGDVLGRPGRRTLKGRLPALRPLVDVIIANAENVAGGFGVTEKTFAELLDFGVSVMTLGNHWDDKPDVHKIRRKDARLVLPQNLPGFGTETPVPEFEIPGKPRKVVVLNLLGMYAMKGDHGNPFEYIQAKREELTKKVRAGTHIVVGDIHAEASSEKQAIAWYLDGVAAAIVGTHTHTPTSDARVTSKGTAFISDIGMTGPYNSVIGMDVPRTLKRYFPPLERGPHEVASENCWFCGLLVEISNDDGLARRAHRLEFRDTEQQWHVTTVDMERHANHC